MPTNLYGPNDNFSLTSSHVLPALIRKFDDGKSNGSPNVVLWGSGKPRREFMHVDDLANALVFLMENYSEADHINVGVGYDVEIRELAQLIREIVGFEGEIVSDKSKPDGTPQKLMDSSRLSALGWAPKIGLPDGIASTYAWYGKNRKTLRAA
jgi:GDP-L-fucose synthase